MAKPNKYDALPHSAAYRAALSSWPKACGSVPTEHDFSVLHTFGIRHGSKHGLALAMYMRAEGATDAQVMAAAHKLSPDVAHQGVLHNYRRAYEAAGHFNRDMTLPKGVYKITLTAKGQAFVDRKAAKAAPVAEVAKPAKAKRKAKAKQAKADHTDIVALEQREHLPAGGASDAQIEACGGPLVG